MLQSYHEQGDTFANAQQKGIDIQHLDSTFMSGLHQNASKAAFAGQEREYMDAYKNMLADLW